MSDLRQAAGRWKGRVNRWSLQENTVNTGSNFFSCRLTAFWNLCRLEKHPTNLICCQFTTLLFIALKIIVIWAYTICTTVNFCWMICLIDQYHYVACLNTPQISITGSLDQFFWWYISISPSETIHYICRSAFASFLDDLSSVPLLMWHRMIPCTCLFLMVAFNVWL